MSLCVCKRTRYCRMLLAEAANQLAVVLLLNPGQTDGIHLIREIL